MLNFDFANRRIARTNEYSSNLADFRLAASTDGKLVVLCADPSENNSDIFGLFYDPIFGAWGNPRQLTHDPQVEYGTTTTFFGTNELIGIYNRTLVSSTNSPDTSLADLAALYYTVTEDLAMAANSIYCDPPNPVAGAIATLHVNVVNLGDKVETNEKRETILLHGAVRRPMGLTSYLRNRGPIIKDSYWPWLQRDLAGNTSTMRSQE